MNRAILFPAILSAAACVQPVETISSNLCQIDPRTGRCKVSEDTLLSRARNAVDDYAYQNYGADSGGVSCGEGTGPGGNGSDPGTFWCTKKFSLGGQELTLDCGGEFDDGGFPEGIYCYYY